MRTLAELQRDLHKIEGEISDFSKAHTLPPADARALAIARTKVEEATHWLRSARGKL